MPKYSVDLVPKDEGDGCGKINLKITAPTREAARALALKQFDFCRLHDNERLK